MGEPAYAWLMFCTRCGRRGLATAHVKVVLESGGRCPDCHGERWLAVGRVRVGEYADAPTWDETEEGSRA